MQRRAVRQRHVRHIRPQRGGLQRPLRQRAQPLQVLRAQGLHRPLGRRPRRGIEVARRCQPAADAVVVAAHRQRRQRPDHIQHLIRRRAIAHHIAQVPQHVPLARRVQYCGQGLQVSVYVGENKSAHRETQFAQFRANLQFIAIAPSAFLRQPGQRPRAVARHRRRRRQQPARVRVLRSGK